MLLANDFYSNFLLNFLRQNSAKTVNENSSDALWIPNPLRVVSVIGQRTSCCKFSFGPKDPLNERNLEAAKLFIRQTAESSRSNGPNNVTSLIIGKSKALAMRCSCDVAAMWLWCSGDVVATAYSTRSVERCRRTDRRRSAAELVWATKFNYSLLKF